MLELVRSKLVLEQRIRTYVHANALATCRRTTSCEEQAHSKLVLARSKLVLEHSKLVLARNKPELEHSSRS